MTPTTSGAAARHRRPAGPDHPPKTPWSRRPRRPRGPTESKTRTMALIGAAALALVVAFVLAWPSKSAPPTGLSAPSHHRAPSTPPTTAHPPSVPPTTAPPTTAPPTTTPPTSTIPTTTVPLSSLSPGSLPGAQGTATGLSTTGGTQSRATPGATHAATPAQKSAVSGAVANPPGPIGDVFVSASDPSYAAVEFGGGQLAYALMENKNGTWTELAEGSPQIPCTNATEYGLPEQVKSDFSGMMQPCG